MKDKLIKYRVRLDDLIGHIFYFEATDDKDLDTQVTKKFGIGVTYRFEIV